MLVSWIQLRERERFLTGWAKSRQSVICPERMGTTSRNGDVFGEQVHPFFADLSGSVTGDHPGGLVKSQPLPGAPPREPVMSVSNLHDHVS